MRIDVPTKYGTFFLYLEVTDCKPTGKLCETCLLPSVVRWETMWLTEDGVNTRSEHEECTDCRPDLFDIEVEDD